MKEKIKDFFLHTLRTFAGLVFVAACALATATLAGIVGKFLWKALLFGFNLFG